MTALQALVAPSVEKEKQREKWRTGRSSRAVEHLATSSKSLVEEWVEEADDGSIRAKRESWVGADAGDMGTFSFKNPNNQNADAPDEQYPCGIAPFLGHFGPLRKRPCVFWCAGFR